MSPQPCRRLPLLNTPRLGTVIPTEGRNLSKYNRGGKSVKYPHKVFECQDRLLMSYFIRFFILSILSVTCFSTLLTASSSSPVPWTRAFIPGCLPVLFLLFDFQQCNFFVVPVFDRQYLRFSIGFNTLNLRGIIYFYPLKCRAILTFKTR